jgi:hypothetical protein
MNIISFIKRPRCRRSLRYILLHELGAIRGQGRKDKTPFAQPMINPPTFM